MSSLTSIAGIALSALNTYTGAISVTNTNIANSETEGYTRQKAVLQATGNGGVDISSVKRVYNSFLTNRLRTATTELGFYDAEQEALTSVESVFNESSTDGLSSYLSDFWNSWNDVVNDPSDSSARTTLLSAADTLADTLNSMSSDLTDLQNSIDDSLTDCVSTVNDLIDQIAALNKSIVSSTASGQDCNTDMDTRDELITELSSYIGINTYTDDSGQICVSMDNGNPLIVGSTTWTLSTQTNATTGLQDITLVSDSGTTTVITDDITTGKMGGYLEVRDDLIPSYQSALDDLASTMITQINALHTTGYDLNGDAGVDFFTGSSASDIAVNSAMIDNSDKIAASSTADGIPDDATIASSIADLQDSLLFNSSTSTCSDFYATLVSKIGSDLSSVESYYDARESLVNSCQSQRDSVSSVSTDEEMVNLTQYQYAYEAAAKMISVVDEMMKTIINL